MDLQLLGAYTCGLRPYLTLNGKGPTQQNLHKIPANHVNNHVTQQISSFNYKFKQIKGYNKILELQ